MLLTIAETESPYVPCNESTRGRNLRSLWQPGHEQSVQDNSIIPFAYAHHLSTTFIFLILCAGECL